MRISNSSFRLVASPSHRKRYLLVSFLLLLRMSAAGYTSTLPATTSQGAAAYGLTASDMPTDAFRSTPIMLPYAASGSVAPAPTTSSGSEIGASVPVLPASGIAPTPAQMASTLTVGAASYSGRNISNPPIDIDPNNPKNHENGTPVGEPLLPLLLLAVFYTLRLRKKIQTKGLRTSAKSSNFAGD